MSKITWTIKGKLKVRSQFEEIKTAFGDANGDVPLEGVRVKVSAKESNLDISGFSEWGQAVTEEDGSFQITKEKDKSKRFFRVEVLFDNSDVKIYPGTLVGLPGGSDFEAGLNAIAFHVDWIKVWEDDEKKGPGVVDFRHLTFAGIAGEQLDNLDERRHADLWFLATKLRSKLEDVGQGLGFLSKTIAIKYPQTDPLIPDGDEIAYADPIRGILFLVRTGVIDNFEIQTVMHELMHVRNYAHSTGESNLATQLLANGTTHDGRQDVTWTGFHEASAEIFKSELYHRMFGKPAVIYRNKKFEAQRRPFTRTFLKQQGLRNLQDVDHFEYGWISVFNLLLCGKVQELDMNGPDTYALEKIGTGVQIAKKSVRFSFEELLRAFDPIGETFPNVISLEEMTLTRFFQRLGAVKPEFDSTMQSAYKKILDPRETAQPSDVLPRLFLMPTFGIP